METENERLEVAQVANPLLFCNSTYTELRRNIGRPYNAVGYLNNGCTAFLIAEDTIATAAHCVVGDHGVWQENLRFYPNFHPSRVSTARADVPRADILRSVVAARTDIGFGSRTDWAISRLGNWRDQGGLDLTPLPLHALPTGAVGPSITSPAYTRHHFPYDDHDAVTWDNMSNADCGQWAVIAKAAPFFDGFNPDRSDCNTRWSAGFIHDQCWIHDTANDVVAHNCAMTGGSSGSPFVGSVNGVSVSYGVHSGGRVDIFSASDPPECVPFDPSKPELLGVGPGAARFLEAPRRAFNVAVHRAPSNASATAVYAVDSDRNTVVMRNRVGGGYQDEFNYWSSLGDPNNGGVARIAACSTSGDRPQLFVTTSNTSMAIRTSLVDSNGAWTAWANFSLPTGVSTVVDLDASTDASGRCQLFMIELNGDAFTRTKTSDTSWGSWTKIADGAFKRITALRTTDLHAVMLDTNGALWRVSRSGGAFSAPVQLPGLAGKTFRDIDMTWDEQGRGVMFAVVSSFVADKGRLHFLPLYGAGAWTDWRFFDTRLYNPDPKNPPAVSPDISSITASRWMEDPAGTTSPVVFGTDVEGNVYFIEYTRIDPSDPAAHWVLDWKSFYDEEIPYN